MGCKKLVTSDLFLGVSFHVKKKFDLQEWILWQNHNLWKKCIFTKFYFCFIVKAEIA